MTPDLVVHMLSGAVIGVLLARLKFAREDARRWKDAYAKLYAECLQPR